MMFFCHKMLGYDIRCIEHNNLMTEISKTMIELLRMNYKQDNTLKKELNHNLVPGFGHRHYLALAINRYQKLSLIPFVYYEIFGQNFEEKIRNKSASFLMSYKQECLDDYVVKPICVACSHTFCPTLLYSVLDFTSVRALLKPEVIPGL